ncbi:hypothetical protein ACFLU6_09865 [Acidobacteriota bacterium]
MKLKFKAYRVRRKSVFFISVLALTMSFALGASVTTRGATLWSETIGGAAQMEKVFDLKELPNGDLLVAGSTDSFGHGAGELWFMKLNADGGILFEQVYGTGLLGGVKAAQILPDQSVIAAGSHVIDFFTKHYGWLLKIDAAGAVEWAVTYASIDEGRHNLYSVTQTSDGGYIATGSTSRFDFPPFYIWVVKVSANGVLEWQQRYGGGQAEEGQKIIQTADGGYAVAGKTNSSGGGDIDVLVLKLGATGAIEWQKTFGGVSADDTTSIVQLADNGYAVTAVTQSFTGPGRAGWVIRIDVSGGLVWQKVIGTDAWCDVQDLAETKSGDIIVVGRLEESGYTTLDLWLIKMGSDDGIIEWGRAYEGDSGDWGYTATELQNGDLLIGASWAAGFSEEDIWLLRLDSSGGMEGCTMIRDTVVLDTSPRITQMDGVVTASAPDQTPSSITFDANSSSGTVAVQCTYTPPLCRELFCNMIGVDPGSACEGEAQTLSLIHTGGEAPYTVEWDFDGDSIPDATGNPVIHTFPAGTHTITATVTDSCANPGPQTCFLSDTVTVYPDSTPTIAPSGPTVFCAQKGESVTLSAGPGYPDYQWALDGIDISGATSEDYVAVASGDYTVTVTDANGCVWTSAPITVNADDCPCAQLSCDSITVDQDPVCEGTSQTFAISFSGGEGAVSVAWDYNGDAVPDFTGNPVTQALPLGTWSVTAVVSDTCTDPGPQTCELSVPATINDAVPPAEVSDTESGHAPLRVTKAPGSLNVAKVPNAVAYNVYADVIGSWYFPTQAKGSVCTITTWIDNGDGTINLDYPIPDDSWFVVTASTPCAEGPAGDNSAGTERTTMGVWELCGPAP